MSAAPRIAKNNVSDQWEQHAPALAAWASSNLVNRRDVYGRYLAVEARTADRDVITAKEPLTLGVLQMHFAGRSTGNLIGLHSTVRDEATGPAEVSCCWSRWLAVDIDRHDDTTDPEATIKAVMVLRDRAVALGFAVLLLDSNGRGGYHLLLVFDGPVATDKVFRFGKWLTRDWRALGLDSEPETFPKQSVIAAGGFGNWLRLPGRHHTREHFTRVWDGSAWLEGTAAIRAIVATKGNAAGLMPADALTPPTPPRKSKGRAPIADAGKDISLAAAALDYLDPSMPYPEWLAVGMALTPLGREGLELWDRWSSASEKYAEGLCDRKWRSFARASGGLTLGSLFHAAKGRGFELPKGEAVAPKAKPATRAENPGVKLTVVGGENEPTNNRPEIECCDISLDSVKDQALQALSAINAPPGVFDFGGQLSWIRADKRDGYPSIQNMTKYAIRNRLAEAATFFQTVETKHGPTTKETFPPMDVVHAVMAEKEWSDGVAPAIDLIAESPRFSVDGRLITDPGYHADSRIYYHPPEEIRDLCVPASPTGDQVGAAVTLLLDDYLGDFPFADNSSQANALACMLLPFVRLMIAGPTPLHYFEASTEGTGKGKCAWACAFPSIGRSLRSHVQKENDAEWRKGITSALLAGTTHVFYDNMYNPISWRGDMVPIDSASFAAVLTQDNWADRTLGISKDVSLKITQVWMGAGNNTEFSKELIRRIAPISLRTPQQDPSARTGFRCEPDTLEEWARKRRRQLLEACLILCQNWVADEMTSGKQIMGSYESYSKVMGGILASAGIAGFLGNLKIKVEAVDRESVRWAGLVPEWHRVHGAKPVTSGELYDLIFGDSSALPGIVELQVSFADLLGDGSALSKKQKLGNALMKQVDRVWGDHRIVTTTVKGRGGVTTYKLIDPAILKGF